MAVARYAHSKRLQRIVAALRSHPGITSLELAAAAYVVNPAESISQLRHPPNNFVIYKEKQADGYTHWFLIDAPILHNRDCRCDQCQERKEDALNDKIVEKEPEIDL